MKIIIIGSGVAGSVLARTLSDEGYNVVVLEKSKRAGGMCKSYYYKGFTYEYGPHILANHHASIEVENFIKKHINTEKTKLTSASFVKNKICYYPPSIHSAEVLGLK
jgi:phytoene dehydrogenase-like protein